MARVGAPAWQQLGEALVAEAQQLMYDAWEAPTRQRAVALAKKALSISPDCADAYTFLAEQTAKSVEEAIDPVIRNIPIGRYI